jgi:hypothetical protein
VSVSKGGLSPLGAALLLLVAAARPGAHAPSRTKVTWAGDIERLVHARCIRCHSPHGKGPMSLVTYEDARPYANAMREEVLARRMPKWHAARGYGQFANDPSLSPFDVALIVSWVDGGALRGDSARPATPVPPRQVSRHADRTLSVPCRQVALPTGRLLAITPALGEGASAGFSVVLPDGRREVLAWIRDYEQEFPETYWLETPLPLPPGSRLQAEAPADCRLTLHFAAAGRSPRSAVPDGDVRRTP